MRQWRSAMMSGCSGCNRSLVSQLATLGVTITDEEAVAMYLRIVPAMYTQIALSIEMLIDLSPFILEGRAGG
jgi:hypothetical protein